MDGTTAAAAGIIGGTFAFIFFFMFAIWILLIVARWKLFTKAGEAGWKSIIPIYSDYVQWRIGWRKTSMFWIYFALVLVGSIVMSMGGVTSEQMMGVASVDASTLANPTLAGIGALLMLIGGIIALVAAYKLFKSFGHGIGMFIAYIFFAPIVLLVLGFGSSQWQGAQE